MSEKGRPLPKFGEWDVNDPASAEGFTVIFNKARDEKKTGGKPDYPTKLDTNTNTNHGMEHVKTQGEPCGYFVFDAVGHRNSATVLVAQTQQNIGIQLSPLPLVQSPHRLAADIPPS